jgi:hypothetical protein
MFACCEAHVIAEQQAIETCGGYDDSMLGSPPNPPTVGHSSAPDRVLYEEICRV